ncbi:sensor histidine kinase [Spirulina subsalsa]|uniref:sensor histidine kinase n=1 Tax=Spirulina subsalsa TaxID=54311 RepID=UPI0002DD2FE2|nr:HAMP domain-containing sensor histidine kinase [Spirulina subsalsa]
MNDEIATLKAELEQAKLAYLRAAQMSQFKAGFLARTSHELRSPLNSLIGLHQLILSDLCEDPEEEREFIQQGYQAALKLLKLIDQIVDISKTEYGAIPLVLESHPISKIFSEIERLTHLQAANRSYPLTLKVPDPDFALQVDLRRVVQVLMSLVDTAIAHMGEGSLELVAQQDVSGEQGTITLTIYSPRTLWTEAVDLLQQSPETTPDAVTNFLQRAIPSPGMNLLLSVGLLETMNGHLKVVATPKPEDSNPYTQVCCVLPCP